MQSTGVLNLSIGLTGVKKNHGAHQSYISCPCRRLHFRTFPSRLHVLQRRRRSSSAARVHAASSRTSTLHAGPPHHRPRAACAFHDARAAALHRACTACATACAAAKHRRRKTAPPPQLTEMGREKRKGKEVVVEKPVHKRTRAEREAERAEMVAKAA